MSSPTGHDDVAVPHEDPHNDVATTALVLGVLSVVFSVLTGVPALVAGLVGLVRSRSRGTGAVRSGAAVLLGAGSVVVAVLAVQALAPVWGTVQAVGEVPAEDVLVSGSPQARAGVAEATEVVEELGVDPSSLDCGSPSPGLEVVLTCTGQSASGEPVDLTGSCPASVLTGEAVCTVDVVGPEGAQEREVRVVLRDGVPEAELLPR
ncbi:DUF4190 domain-containing protein [uncultured Pseudokineococcus sp.]|uniref:DUF4190 domain-containing protein n=1 Tax=uncultured Pseudokineococcus sp. TaxID=1642928 RepID=UPI002630828C|nr:DUF4190 domain-containing protein [uncultured Pseudokineococcus sp.]